MSDETTPQDDAAMPPASTGSANGWRFGDCEQRDEWINEALKASFLGVPVGELSLVELQAAFGSLMKMRLLEQELTASVRNMFRLAKQA